MSTTSQFFSGGTTIKSIQRGTVTAGSTATITSVNTAKSELRLLGQTGLGSASIAALANSFGTIVLTNATTITATGNAGTLSWELTEWN